MTNQYFMITEFKMPFKQITYTQSSHLAKGGGCGNYDMISIHKPLYVYRNKNIYICEASVYKTISSDISKIIYICEFCANITISCDNYLLQDPAGRPDSADLSLCPGAVRLWGCLTLENPSQTQVSSWHGYMWWLIFAYMYRKTSNISHTLVGKKIVDHSDVVGASPVGAAPTTSSFST